MSNAWVALMSHVWVALMSHVWVGTWMRVTWWWAREVWGGTTYWSVPRLPTHPPHPRRHPYTTLLPPSHNSLHPLTTLTQLAPPSHVLHTVLTPASSPYQEPFYHQHNSDTTLTPHPHPTLLTLSPHFPFPLIAPPSPHPNTPHCPITSTPLSYMALSLFGSTQCIFSYILFTSHFSSFCSIFLL